MERSRTSRLIQLGTFFISVALLGTLFLGACGQNSQIAGTFGLNGFATESNLADQSDQQNQDNGVRPYLSLTPADEVKAIRNEVKETEDNKQFANQVVRASIIRVNTGAEVKFYLAGVQKPLLFKGELTQKGLFYIGDFPETTGVRPDLTLYISCSDQGCNHADLFLSDQQGHKAAIVVTTENRILNGRVPLDETEDQLRDSGLPKFQSNQEVLYTLTEVFPGKTHYEVRTKTDQPQTLFDGEVASSATGLVQTQLTAIDPKLKTSLAGIDSNNIVFQIETKPDPKKPEDSKALIVQVSNPKHVEAQPTTKPVTNVPNCKISLPPQVNPMIDDIVKECNQKAVNDMISTWWKKDAHKNFVDFMGIYQNSKSAKPNEKGNDFKNMLEVLHKNNFPTIWSWVTQVESTFNKDAVGPSKELGVWQISPANRAHFKISVQQAKDVVIETGDALNDLYAPLIEKFKGNIPMILASYNKGSLAKSEVRPYTSFWNLCRLSTDWSEKGFRLNTCKYVPRIISGMLVSLDPKAYGMQNIEAMEAQ